MATVPPWLHLLASISLGLAAICALLIGLDIARGHRQNMWVMNVVWPVTALWAGPLALIAYFKVGRLATRARFEAARAHDEQPAFKGKPFWESVGVGVTHCGAGCTLGDLAAEWLVVLVPVTVFGQHVFGTWALDFFLALLIGIAFQYFTIAPMRDMSVGKSILAALKADTLSLTAWQVGMYGWMALALFVFYSEPALPKSGPTFWFMMQIAMVCGFLTSYPVNWWLLRTGLKGAM